VLDSVDSTPFDGCECSYRQYPRLFQDFIQREITPTEIHPWSLLNFINCKPERKRYTWNAPKEGRGGGWRSPLEAKARSAFSGEQPENGSLPFRGEIALFWRAARKGKRVPACGPGGRKRASPTHLPDPPSGRCRYKRNKARRPRSRWSG
jgi:hypothetical protein